MNDTLRRLTQIGGLKALSRAGWVRRGIPQPESVAAHCFRTAILALALGPELGVDLYHLLKMLLVHDLGESDPSVGDITPFDGIAPDEKHRREAAAMQSLCSGLPNGEEILALWREYEAGQSREAKIAKELDCLEMALQSSEYEAKLGLKLDEFRERSHQIVEHSVLRKLLAAIDESCAQSGKPK